MFGAIGPAHTRSAVTFVSQAALDRGIAAQLRLAKPIVAVRNRRKIPKRDLVHNGLTPHIDVDAQNEEAPMLRLTRRILHSEAPVEHVLELPFESRSRSRLRSRLTSGQEVVLMLERGHVLRDGDILVAEDGTLVRVQAARETLSVVRGQHARELARAAYHLGNRHVALEVGEGWLSYLHDHVSDDMVRGLGLSVEVEARKFEPESGAYGHAHEHTDEHEHEHAPDERGRP